MGSELKRPNQRRPARMRVFCSVSAKECLEEMAQIRSCSELDVAFRILAVASFHEVVFPVSGFRKSWGSWERKPMSTIHRMSSGKPA